MASETRVASDAAKKEGWFAEASARFPSVKWDRIAFYRHLGKESPRFPLDLFLAGAAGYRLDSAWEVIEADLGPKARSVLQRQPLADLSAEELWGETILRLIAEDEQKPMLPDGRRPAYIIRYRGLVQLLNYLIVIAKRVAIGRKRRMRPTVSLSGKNEDEGGHDVTADAPSPAEISEGGEEASALRSAIATAYGRLSPEQRFLIAMVYRSGMKQKEAGTMLGWSEFKTCRSLAAAMEDLRKSIARWAGSEWDGQMAAAWEESLQKCWKNVQLPGKSASMKPAR
jgi:DNA-directed RNA polymerase specialized sigma24 family protein